MMSYYNLLVENRIIDCLIIQEYNNRGGVE